MQFFYYTHLKWCTKWLPGQIIKNMLSNEQSFTGLDGINGNWHYALHMQIYPYETVDIILYPSESQRLAEVFTQIWIPATNISLE